MKDLSVIIPHVNEWPQILWTVRSIQQELNRKGINYEIITIDNYCEEVSLQGHRRDPSEGALKAAMGGNSWLKALTYTEKLSHWNAKIFGIDHAEADILFFADAHTCPARGSVDSMFEHYVDNWKKLKGSIHLPLTYQLLEWHRQIYGLDYDLDKGTLHYRFVSFPKDVDIVFQVPCMSTCGMMIHREYYEAFGGWSPELGIYGGGENLINFAMGMLGLKKWIYRPGTLFHHAGDPKGWNKIGTNRRYHWYWLDHLRNRTIAAYIYGGKEWAEKFLSNCDGVNTEFKGKTILEILLDDVFESCEEHRSIVKSAQVFTVEEWVSIWEREQWITRSLANT